VLLGRFKFAHIIDTYISAEDFLKDISNNKPDIVFVDVHLKGMNGFDLVRILKKEEPDLKIVIISFSDDAPIVHEALELGVSGYVTKDLDPENLRNVFDAVQKGEKYITSSAALNYAHYLMRISESKGKTSPLTKKDFSERELDVIALMYIGKTEKEMADKLNVSVKTIQKDKKNITIKLKVKKQTEIISAAQKFKILS
jgi:DNA-binding NarL/FixJ family response regulator